MVFGMVVAAGTATDLAYGDSDLHCHEDHHYHDDIGEYHSHTYCHSHDPPEAEASGDQTPGLTAPATAGGASFLGGFGAAVPAVDPLRVISIGPAYPMANTTDSRLLVFNVTFNKNITDAVTANRSNFAISPEYGNPGEVLYRPSTATSVYDIGDNPYMDQIVDHLTIPDDIPVARVFLNMTVYSTLARMATIQLVPPSGDPILVHNRTWTISDYVHEYNPGAFLGGSSGEWSLVLSYDHAIYNTLTSWTLTVQPPAVSCGNGSCLVPVFPAGNGLYNLDITPTNAIADLNGIRLINPATVGLDHTYNVTGLE